MEKGDIVELTKDMTFHRAGKKAHFIRIAQNPKKAEVVWMGEEEDFKKYGDVELVPLDYLAVVKGDEKDGTKRQDEGSA